MKRRIAKLTPREQEVVILITLGLSKAQIASDLGITVRTVNVHRSNAMKKLNVKNAVALVRAAIQMRLFER